MLRWDGKKPLERVEYYPAQEKEVYGEKKAREFNELFWGDNLQVLGHLMKQYRGKIDLIYIDPPFDSKADYVKKVKMRGEEIIGTQKSIIEEKQYGDIWERDEYLQFMYERLILLRELLSERGSFYLHCDWRKVSHLRLVLDEVFGEENLQREIVWNYENISGFKSIANNWIHGHDSILFYTKSKQFIFNKQRQAYSEEYLKNFDQVDEEGRRYWQWSANERRYFDELKDGIPYGDVLDIKYENNMSSARTNYPTQKPEKLLELIIRASSNAGDTVLDCFIGSGTTAAVAQKLGRKWIGCDINIGAIQTATKRLNQIIAAQLKGKSYKDAWLLSEKETVEAKRKTAFGFKVFNVNDYDVFKNEVEAKEIVMELYGVERVRLGYFDGVLDNRFVKVMPLNRVLSKKDVDAVIKGIEDNLDSFEVKKKSRHGEALYEQGVIVFCSGLEMDALDYLKKKNDTGVEVDVRDILLDKQGVIFKKKPEAEISVKAKGNKVTVKIEDFISPILMRKLEIENDKALKKEAKAKVEDFRQIIDSVAVDVDYDGVLFNAEIIDVPAKNELIKAEYIIEYPKKGKQALAIKIVDVLGEEYFETFEATV